MAANGDATQLKGIEIIPWEKPGKAAAAQLDTESKFDQSQYFTKTVDSTNYDSYFTSSYDFLFYPHWYKLYVLPDTPQKEKVDSQIPLSPQTLSPQTPSGKLRPKCKYCKNYMLGHDKAACNTSRNSIILSPNTTSSPSTKSTLRSPSPPTKEGPSRLPPDDPALHLGDPTSFLRLVRNLPASRNVFFFENLDDALSFQSKVHKLSFNSALHVYSSPDTSQADPIFVAIGENKEDVYDALQACLRPGPLIKSALWPHA